VFEIAANVHVALNNNFLLTFHLIYECEYVHAWKNNVGGFVKP
jgi:hypothetical protein